LAAKSLRPTLAAGREPSDTFPAMDDASAEAVIEAVAAWVRARDDLRALALVGSWARGTPGPASDVDLLVLSDCLEGYRRSREWMSEIDFARAGHSIKSSNDVSYGAVWSRHIHLHPAGEVELTFAPCAWASVAPIDEGTSAIVSDAFRIIVDKGGSLAGLVSAVTASKQT
jgi:predicted nucleotidyltransferase